MNLTAPELGKLLHSQLRRGIGSGADGQGDKHLVGVEPGVPVAQMLGLQMLDGINDHGGNQMNFVPDTAQGF